MFGKVYNRGPEVALEDVYFKLVTNTFGTDQNMSCGGIPKYSFLHAMKSSLLIF